MSNSDSSYTLFVANGFVPKELAYYAKKCHDHFPAEIREQVVLEYCYLEPQDDNECLWLSMRGEAVRGVLIQSFGNSAEDGAVLVTIPHFASGMDVYLALCILNAVAAAHPEVYLYYEDGEPADISPEAGLTLNKEHNDAYVALLESPEDYVDVPCLAGEWRMDVKSYRKKLAGLSKENQAAQIKKDILSFIWGDSIP